MAQFRIHRNLSSGASRGIPFLLDIQTDLLGDMATRLVVPLYRRNAYLGDLLAGLMPTFDAAGEMCVAVIPEMASVPAKCLGSEIADASSRRSDILSAVDLLISGF
ncbi:MAG: CcdB family protein [Dechloromonas sp.]|jgi:toxin CcdB|nr:CcdB family protein [Dechloromonas sp.]